MKIFNRSLACMALFTLPLSVIAQEQNEENWIDLSDPRAIYSSVSVAAGNEGVNISGSYGGYLNGQYKHKITLEAMNDLDYYNVDYMLINASNNTGFSFESTWDRDVWGIRDVNDTSIGVFTKVPLMNNKLNVYPKLDLGMLWGDDVKSTTYIKFDATTRYSFTNKLWVGVSPTYTYAMKGIELSEWYGSVDAGIQLSESFAFSVHYNTDQEFSVKTIFTF
ncbi:hypothetical protein CW745_07235 [Psychromonas sp. psych-6C06]|uniref:hypothetical protein n=1 Tax=Psychromonas sp. psych-6C06 TaxID=2058089 RepID=UPI000C34018C|nr:hypothetical protein [Psychromonas sp. psych-6C06]PKF62181.1 hypothetical protein CW745_07235 [Psychromonas sp. psych-6C06]